MLRHYTVFLFRHLSVLLLSCSDWIARDHPFLVNYCKKRTLPGINRVTPARQTNFHSSFGAKTSMLWLCVVLCVGSVAQHTVMIKIFSDAGALHHFFYLFVFIQERVLLWLRTVKCKSFHALRLWCQRYRLRWWMYSYSRLQNRLYDLAQCVSLLYRFSVPELKLKRSELTHSILSLFSHSLPPLYIWLSSPLMSREVIRSQCQDWEAFCRIRIIRLGFSSLLHTFFAFLFFFFNRSIALKEMHSISLRNSTTTKSLYIFMPFLHTCCCKSYTCMSKTSHYTRWQ